MGQIHRITSIYVKDENEIRSHMELTDTHVRFDLNSDECGNTQLSIGRDHLNTLRALIELHDRMMKL